MCNFKIGEKVVCVDMSPSYVTGLPINLKLHEIYTVAGFNPFDFGLILLEVQTDENIYGSFNNKRFRKLDHQFAEDVIAYITELETVNI